MQSTKALTQKRDSPIAVCRLKKNDFKDRQNPFSIVYQSLQS
jgi:hypothetical protein